MPQEDAKATYAPMLQKETGRIDWDLPAGRVHDLVRGLCPWPVAWTELGGRKLKIFRVKTLDRTGKPGEMAEQDGAFLVYCGEGAVELIEVQPENGRRMSGSEYLRGHPLGRK